MSKPIETKEQIVKRINLMVNEKKLLVREGSKVRGQQCCDYLNASLELDRKIKILRARAARR